METLRQHYCRLEVNVCEAVSALSNHQGRPPKALCQMSSLSLCLVAFDCCWFITFNTPRSDRNETVLRPDDVLLYIVAQKVRTFSVMFITKHVLLSCLTKLSENVYQLLNKMFNVSSVSSKNEFRFSS